MELQGQLLNLHQKNARIFFLKHITIPHSSMYTGNQELTQQLQTSNFEINDLKTEVF